MNILDKIVLRKKIEIQERKSSISYNQLEKTLFFSQNSISLKDSINSKNLSIIAEHKRKSPSKSEINFSTPTNEIIKGYQDAGAAAISVLTDSYFFGGSNEDLNFAKKNSAIPVLRKEFIIDEFQIIESKSIGADAILLIASILNENQIINLSRLAKKNNLDVLIEVHTLEELKKSLNENIDLIGVNNRNLKTFKVDLENSINICNQIPENFTKISESGLNSIDDIRILVECGFDGFLIGEQFMREKDPGSKLKELINSY